jgi:hypothetical protein
MNNVIPLTHPVTSSEVVEKLIELGYLKETKRQNSGAVDHALARLKEDLCRNQPSALAIQFNTKGNGRNQSGLIRIAKSSKSNHSSEVT